MKVLGITIGTIVIYFMFLGMIYFWGVGQIHPKYDNDFFKPKTPWITLDLTHSDVLAAHSDYIVWLNVAVDKNGTFYAVDSLDEKKVYSDFSQFPQLDGVIKKFSSHRIILNLISNAEDIDRTLTKYISNFKISFLIQSDFDVILRASKETNANFPYGSSQADRLRFLSFEGMAPWANGLLPATPFRGDVYITPLKWKNTNLITTEVAKELRRRQKSIILGPLKTESDLEEAKKYSPDGYYLEDLSLISKIQ